MNIFLWLVGLTFLNALFSTFEMSLAACRELKLKALESLGNTRATRVLELRRKPTLFIGTAQLALNAVAILSGVYVESVLSEPIASLLIQLHYIDSTTAKTIATCISILIITIIFLLFGDLIPKRIAMLYPESIACAIVGIFSKIVMVTTPILKILDYITEHIATKLKTSNVEDGVTFEEVCLVIEQGIQSGAVEKSSMHIVENALNLDDRNITEIMIPRTEIDFIDSTLPRDELIRKLKSNPYHRYILCKENIDHVLGIIDLTDLIPIFSNETDLNLDVLVKPMHYIPETLTLQEGLTDLQLNQKTLAMVINEFGEVIGMVRLTDIHNAIVGKTIATEENNWITTRNDGSWIVSGDAPVSIVKNTLGLTTYLDGEEQSKYHTVNGMVMYLLHRMPKEGDILMVEHFTIEVIDIDKHLVDKVLIQPKK